jgi:hypothetical protein
MKVRDLVSPGQPFAIGLRLSAKAAAELLRGEELNEFKTWLGEENAYYGTFLPEVRKLIDAGARTFAPRGTPSGYTAEFAEWLRATGMSNVLIGGISIRIGDEVIDASVRGKLAQLADALMN